MNELKSTTYSKKLTLVTGLFINYISYSPFPC